MKKLILLLPLSIILACNSSKKPEDDKNEVTLTFTSTSDYCGGAKPNDKIINDLLTPKSYSDKDIMLSTDNKLNDSMITLSVNAEGKVTTKLDARTYYIFLPSKVYSNFSAGGDETACKNWKNSPDGTFDVEKGNTEVEIKLHKNCSPCGARRM